MVKTVETRLKWLMSITIAFWSILLLTNAFDMSSKQSKLSENPRNRIYYQVFLRSFYDSNGDGIGDIQGLIQKLDYIQELGAEGIWLLPIHPSPSYHKYDVLDYYAIDPVYGNMKDFKELLSEAKARDIKVLIDLVLNHTSWDIDWFTKARKGKENKYRDYYVWKEAERIEEEEHNWHTLPEEQGMIGSPEKYYGFFWKGMPDLNFDNPEVRAVCKEIGRFWLEEVGVDGFRLDAALHIYPFYSKHRAIHLDKTIQWWQEFKAAMEAIKPDVFLVGEVWESRATTTRFYENALHAVFNFELAERIAQTLITEKDTAGLIQSLMAIREEYQKNDAQ